MKRKGIVGVVGVMFVGLVLGVVLTAKANLMGRLKAAPESKTATTSTVSTPSKNFITIPSFADIAEEVLPAVVSIEAKGKQVINLPTMDPFEFFFGRPAPRVRETRSLGSGFIFKRDGDTYYVMTNNHVIRGMDKITVKLSDGSIYEGAEVVGGDSATDIAVLKFKSKNELPLVKLGDSDKLRVGDWVMAVGSPFGFSSTVTVGVISAKHRELGGIPEAPTIQDFLQTDAAINPGNSGGPLVNVKGEVVGVNTAIVSPTGSYSGIGFAVPINIARKVSDQLIKEGKVSRGYLGIIMQNVDENLAKVLGLKKPEGVIITEVVKGSPADKAGLQEGDVIVEVDGRKIKNALTLRTIIQSKMPGEKVRIKILRKGKSKIVTVKLGSLDSRTAFMRGGNTLVDEEVGIVATYKDGKVVVEKVKPDSPAGRIGQIRPGDIILKINDMPIKNLDDLEKALQMAKKKGSVLMVLKDPGGMKKWIGFNL
ncbi:MAG: Do family serine endopeptidase [Thermotogae bacterium]|nr:Do family serine endopeptidase [Thermotogota bacterium]